MAKKASKNKAINNFAADKGCGKDNGLPAGYGGKCRRGFHCAVCFDWLSCNPGQILNKPKPKAKPDTLAQLRTELTAALARISALEASASLSASPKSETAPAEKPGSDSAVSELTSEAERLGMYDDPALPGCVRVKSSKLFDRSKCVRWRWARSGCAQMTPIGRWSEPVEICADVLVHYWNRGDADVEVRAVRSSADRPPRVGDVVQYLADATEYTVVRTEFDVENCTFMMAGNLKLGSIGRRPWVDGSFTILREGSDPHVCNAYDNQAAVIAEREKMAWNAALDAADRELERWSWYPDGEERRRIRALRK